MELSDIMFFVNTVKYPSPNFNILYYYYQVIFILIDYPDYGTLFPPIDPTSSSIKSQFIWSRFLLHFQSDNPCSFHFLCPCAKCKLTCTNFCIRS